MFKKKKMRWSVSLRAGDDVSLGNSSQRRVCVVMSQNDISLDREELDGENLG